MPQRSPVIAWLVLAATLTVNAVATLWMFESGMNTASATLFISLAFGQLSVLCVWAVLACKRIRGNWIVPFVAGALAAALMASSERSSRIDEWEPLVTYTALLWLHVAIVLPIVWLLKPTRLCVAFSDDGSDRGWQFSMMHLMVAMTCVAILCVLLGRSETLADVPLSLATLPLANTVLLTAIMAAMKLPRHWFLRFSASLAAALIVAAVCEMTQIAFADELDFVVYTLIQTVAIWIWLELMRPNVIPMKPVVSSAETAPTPLSQGQQG